MHAGQGRSARVSKALVLGALALLLPGAAGALWWKLGHDRIRSDPVRLRRLSQVPLLALGGPAGLGDWPQWRGPNRDGSSTEDLTTDWPSDGPRLLWQAPVGRGFSCPVVAGDRVYTLAQEDGPGDAHEVVACRDTATGRLRWTFRYPGRYDERFGSGPRATPAVAGGYVYTVGPTGIFHCLRADTGEKVWRHDLLDEFTARVPRYGLACSPLVEGDRVIVTPGGPGAAVAAFDRRSGRLLWKAVDDPIGYSSPVATSAAGTRQVLVLTNTALVSLCPDDGRAYWRHLWRARGGFNIATPLAFGDYVFVSSGYGKGCALLEIATGPDGLRAGVVFEHARMRNTFASSVRYREHLYGFDDSHLVCLDVRTGKEMWRETGRKFQKGSLLIAGGHLLVLGEYGRLSLAEATPRGYREKTSFRVSQHKCWTVPVLAGGRLYIRDEGRLVCLDVARRQQVRKP
jgi:outer membrane protein assembly factor BamB